MTSPTTFPVPGRWSGSEVTKRKSMQRREITEETTSWHAPQSSAYWRSAQTVQWTAAIAHWLADASAARGRYQQTEGMFSRTWYPVRGVAVTVVIVPVTAADPTRVMLLGWRRGGPSTHPPTDSLVADSPQDAARARSQERDTLPDAGRQSGRTPRPNTQSSRFSSLPGRRGLALGRGAGRRAHHHEQTPAQPP